MSRPSEEHAHPVDPLRVRQVRERLPSPEDTQRLSAVLSLMGDPTRLRLLHALELVEELCVGDLALAVGTTEDAAGYGLRVLRTAGLVARRKAGRVGYYRLAVELPEPLRLPCLGRLAELVPGPEDGEEPRGRGPVTRAR